MSIEIKPSGTKIHRNDEGKYHREDGPAVEYSNGFGLYYLNGKKVKKEEIDSLSWDIPEPKIIPTLGWNVYLNGKWIDTVFYSETDPEEVKRSLVNHDGFDPGIVVKKERRRRHSWDIPSQTINVGDRVKIRDYIDQDSLEKIGIGSGIPLYERLLNFRVKAIDQYDTWFGTNFVGTVALEPSSYCFPFSHWDLFLEKLDSDKQSWDVLGFFSVGDIIGVKDPERFYIHTGRFEKSMKGKKLEIIRVDYSRHPEWPIEWREGEIVVSIIDPNENYKDKVPETFSVPVSVANEIIEIL